MAKLITSETQSTWAPGTLENRCDQSGSYPIDSRSVVSLGCTRSQGIHKNANKLKTMPANPGATIGQRDVLGGGGAKGGIRSPCSDPYCLSIPRLGDGAAFPGLQSKS